MAMKSKNHHFFIKYPTMLSDLGIILLSCGIGIGSFAAGSIPLALKL
jgi:hypothetical protein